MSNETGLVFQVETEKILSILASEIYDSPLALLRENLQNAYDAVRMRFVPGGTLSRDGRIDLIVSANTITVTDNGIGMTEAVLQENFWKAGSSGKRSDEARQAGVVGTFGIGAMANFGVSSELTVRTRAIGNVQTLVSNAKRDKLKIGENCISLERLNDESPVGTTITVRLLPNRLISPEQARRYLEPYVSFLPVPVYLNGQVISGQNMESRLQLSGRAFTTADTASELDDGTAYARFAVRVDQNGQVLVDVTDVKLGGASVEGSILLLQSGGSLLGLRSFFGLSPIPSVSVYQFGGFANLSFLQPTAGREAVSRDSINQVNRLLALADRAASKHLAELAVSDKNTAFIQWLVSHGEMDKAKHITIRIHPEDVDIPFGELGQAIGTRTAHYYMGNDKETVKTFSGLGACLFQVAQPNPRRTVQLHWLRQRGVQQIPDSPRILRTYSGSELDWVEGSIIVRATAILRDDYIVPDVQVVLSDISHGVSIFPLQQDGHLTVHLSKTSPLLPPLVQIYNEDYQLFQSFVKDFVRNHIYPHIQNFVPSSTRQGVDALRKILERNRELYRYEETETGELESVLQDLLPRATMAEVLQKAQNVMRVQTQLITQSQVGTVENILPDVARVPPAQPVAEDDSNSLPRPPILRDEILSNMKILLADAKYPQLNNFSLLLGVSDRLMREYADFFRTPHTTRILWGGHRVIYIFSEPTGRLSLYYDVELKEPLEEAVAGGALFPTTTLITQKRIFVPVPDPLVYAFKVTTGPREFYVRFDLLVGND